MEDRDGSRSRLARLMPERPRWARVACAAICLLAVAAAILLAVDISRTTAAFESAAHHTALLEDQISAGRMDQADSTVRAIQADTQAARSHTKGFRWAVAAFVPFIGDDVAAVRAVADSAASIAETGLPAMVSAARALNGRALTPRDGRIDVAALTDLGHSVDPASRVLDAEGRRIERIRPADLVDPLAVRVRDLQRRVEDARSAAHTVALAARIAPALLGTDKPRSYLLVFQNNAEIRPTGGLMGAYVFLGVDEGALSISDPGSAEDLNAAEDVGANPVHPGVALTADEKSMYPSTFATDIRSVNFTPDFPRAAALAQGIVRERLGRKVDGVLSIDPVALSYVLRGTGPVALADGTTLTSRNAVRVLLNDVYRKIPDREAQDLYFAAAARLIFDKVTAGSKDSRQVLRSLAQSVGERRVMFWAADPSEQAEIAGTALANELPRNTTPPEIGLYLTDASEAKMQYYLDYETKVESIKCSSAGVQTFVATTTMTSRAPARLPIAVTGSKLVHGNQRLIARYYAPVGGAVTSAATDQRAEPIYNLEHHGRPVSYAIVDVAPGQTVTVKATMVSARKQPGDGRFLTTPGLKPLHNGRSILSACAAAG